MRTSASRTRATSAPSESDAAPVDLADELKTEAQRLGFALVGIAPAVTPPGYRHHLDWLAQGHAAGMAYMQRQAEARAHPEHVLAGARSVIVAGLVYGTQHDERPASPRTGKVARYARGADYHEVFWRRLEALGTWLEAKQPGAQWRAVADTAPLLERDFARLAGMGWIGKNTMLIHKRLGSFTLLGALLTDLELSYDAPFEPDHCGTCTRCLEACPTDAFVGPYQLDAGRCISYWTIEHRGAIPEEFASQLHGWVFGCDICQEVCPWNRKAPAGGDPSLAPRSEWVDPDLVTWLEADDAQLRQMLKGTALSRAKRTGLLRNAALILGQREEQSAVPALIRRLRDPDGIVRAACAWALGRIASREALDALAAAPDAS